MGDQNGSSIEQFLRPLHIDWMRSPYAIEVTPWTTRGDIEAALFFRGTIVSAHGYVETRLAELCFRCSKLPEYATLRGSFPYSFPDRLAYLRKAFELSPLAHHQDTAERFFRRVEAQADLRHLFAHARMQVLPDWGATFHDFKAQKGMPMAYRQFRMTLRNLEREAWNAARLSRICQRLADNLETLDLLPSLEDCHVESSSSQSQ